MITASNGLRFSHGTKCVPCFVVLLFLVAGVSVAKANLVIDGTFGNSITSLSDASTVEAGIDAAITRLEAAVATPITVYIDFESIGTGLGESDTYYQEISYSQYTSDLQSLPMLSGVQQTALASLPVQTDNPVDGDPNMYLTLPLLRAINDPTYGTYFGGLDSTISLNLSIINASRTGTQNPDDYDLQAVVAHEMDEALGIGGAGSVLNSGTTGPVRPMDLFRYSASGVRSFSESSDVTSYFSINGGVTDLVHFNQTSAGDFGDWGNGTTPAENEGNTPPQVQDAFGDPGVDVNIGLNELTALNAVGYELAPVPEPSGVWLLGGGVIVVAIALRRKLA